MINDNKKLCLIGTRQQTINQYFMFITFGEYDIDPALGVKNLGVWFDNK